MKKKLTFEEVVFENGSITNRKGIFHTVKNNDNWVENLILSLNDHYMCKFEIKDYGECYLVFNIINETIEIQLEPL